jgi:hypothetical protein
LLVKTYLSDETLSDVDQHCPLIALPSDVARSGLEPRASYTALVDNMARIFRAALPDEPGAQRKAFLIVTLCVGGMVLARTTDEPKLQKELRAAARAEALALLDA